MNWRFELFPQRWDTLSQGLGVQDGLPEYLRPVGLVSGQTFLIGRNHCCDILVPSTDVERFKARIWHDGEAVWLENKSYRGTWCQRHGHPHFAAVTDRTRLEVD